MKFLADMGISLRSVDFLQDMGYDTTHLHEEGLDRLSDSDILVPTHQQQHSVVYYG